MSEPILYIDTSEIREGRLTELKATIGDLVSFVAENEPRAISYNVYIDESGTRMFVVQLHPDSESLEFHMQIAGPAFPKFTELIKLVAIDVYGKPSDDLLQQLRQKAELLGDGTVRVNELHARFARLGTS